jgi:hypothetical protein
MINFPIEKIGVEDSVLCLCCAAFEGANDVIHIYEKGVEGVFLVDNNEEALLRVARKYGYPCKVSDWKAYIDKCIRNERRYDVIVLDGWTDMDEEVWGTLDDILQVCNKVAIIGMSDAYAKEKGYDMSAAVKRSDYGGGVYWVICEKDWVW